MEFYDVIRDGYSCKRFDDTKPSRAELGQSTNTYVYPGGKRNSGVEDASIVATHMLLAARNLGVDSCWVNRLDPDVLASELGLPENEVVLMALDLGHAAEGTTALPNHSKRKPLVETVTYL